MKLKLLIILSFSSFLINSQTFNRKYSLSSTSSSVYDIGSCAPITQTTDNGYILNYYYTYANTHGGYANTKIIKTDSNFTPLWSKNYYYQNGIKTFTFDDNSIVLFKTPYSGHTFSFELEKLGANGETIWRKYDYEISASDNKISIKDAFQTDESILKLGGIKHINFGQIWNNSTLPVIMDFDLDGNYLQGVSISVPNPVLPYVERMCKDFSGSSYYVVIKNSRTRYLVKLSISNSVIWCKELDFSNYSFTNVKASTVLSNGDILIAGIYENYNANEIFTLALVRITSDGNLLWSKTINDFRSSITSIKELTENEIIVSGTLREDGYDRSIIFNMDGNANIAWAKKYSNSFLTGEMFQKTSDDWYFPAFSYSFETDENQPYVFNTNSNGMANCNTEDITINWVNNPLTLITQTSASEPLTLLNPITTADGTDAVTQIHEDQCIPLLSTPNQSEKKKFKIFPNPTSGSLTIKSSSLINKITVRTILGKKVGEYYPNQKRFIFTIKTLGMYLVNIQSANLIQTFKISVQ